MFKLRMFGVKRIILMRFGDKSDKVQNCSD